MAFHTSYMHTFSKFLVRLLASSTLIFATSLTIPALAQPGSGGPAPTAPAAVPLDGGASLLLASGVGYALRKLRQRRRK